MAGLSRFAALTAGAILLVLSSVADAQKFDRRAVVTSATDVYERVPQFVTGRGWQGNRIASLPPSTQVYVCAERSADFGLSSKVWLQIAFRNSRGGKGEWAYGWVMKEAVTAARVEPGYSIFRVAFADDAPAGGRKVEWDLGAPPPAPPAADSGPGVPGGGSTTLGDLTVLYGPLFIAMLLGMVAKTAVDCLDSSNRRGALIEHIRNGSIAILVSPIVFLGFLQAGEFGASTQAFLVLWLLAFQNGFFWQTVLKRQGSENKKAG
jgi:hypothetical protein